MFPKSPSARAGGLCYFSPNNRRILSFRRFVNDLNHGTHLLGYAKLLRGSTRQKARNRGTRLNGECRELPWGQKLKTSTLADEIRSRIASCESMISVDIDGDSWQSNRRCFEIIRRRSSKQTDCETGSREGIELSELCHAEIRLNHVDLPRLKNE